MFAVRRADSSTGRTVIVVDATLDEVREASECVNSKPLENGLLTSSESPQCDMTYVVSGPSPHFIGPDGAALSRAIICVRYRSDGSGVRVETEVRSHRVYVGDRTSCDPHVGMHRGGVWIEKPTYGHEEEGFFRTLEYCLSDS